MALSSRRLLLTLHVVASVGWVGSVVGFLALNVTALRSESLEVVRAAYLAMNILGLYVIVPSAILSLGSGIVQSLITPWGLVRHVWVVTKLVLTVVATLALLLHQFTAVTAAAALALQDPTSAELHGLGVQLLIDASLAIVVLIAATVLSVFKPWGPTRYGRRVADAEPPPRRGSRVAIGVGIALLVAFVAFHLAGGGHHMHGH